MNSTTLFSSGNIFSNLDSIYSYELHCPSGVSSLLNCFVVIPTQNQRRVVKNNRIIVLPEAIANRIAAGEIIERPSSVIRELLDNAIDATASRIEIDIRSGGLALISVTDDGCGIDPDSLLLAFERHATSKISVIEDLDNINTLGFRGEALPSIASVSKVIMDSYVRDAENGCRLVIEGGILKDVQPVACAPGTKIQVHTLFYNVPARRKFLKSARTEYGHVFETIIDHALTNPQIHFVFREDDRVILDIPMVDRWAARITAALGEPYLREMIPIDTVYPDTQIEGYICDPEFLQATGRSQRLYINGRRTRDRLVTQAVYRGYQKFLTSHKHPVFLLKLNMPPTLLDVNVHPAKSEVRFRDSQRIFFIVQQVVENALAGSLKRLLPSSPTNPETPDHSSSVNAESTAFHNITILNAPKLEPPRIPLQFLEKEIDQGIRMKYDSSKNHEDVPIHTNAMIQPNLSLDHSLQNQEIYQDWKVIGQLYQTFILVETASQLLIIDQHTAHERILYERFMRQYRSGVIPSQSLMFPVPVDLEPQQALVIQEFSDLLREFGMVVEPFGKDSFLIRSLPEHLHQEVPELLLKNIADDLLEVGSSERSRRSEQKMLVTLSCRRAIKSGDSIDHLQMKALVSELFRHPLPSTCPHGRPIIIRMDRHELELKFRR